jgi:Mg2+/Co2+ transporter CorB
MSGFFSLSETAMMASNRFRLRHLAQSGHHGAQKALALLNSTDKMLGVILLGNNLVNSAAATLVSVIAIELFGEEKWALGASTMIVTFAILVFSEITPKIIGATHADRLALVLGHILTPLLRLAYPAVWFINLFVSGLLRLLRLTPKQSDKTNHLSPEELRSLVLESSHLIPKNTTPFSPASLTSTT